MEIPNPLLQVNKTKKLFSITLFKDFPDQLRERRGLIPADKFPEGENKEAVVLNVTLTGAGGAALLRVGFGVLAVDDTLDFGFGDDAFLSQQGGKDFLQVVNVTLILLIVPPCCPPFLALHPSFFYFCFLY